jgi:hypothetical protein
MVEIQTSEVDAIHTPVSNSGIGGCLDALLEDMDGQKCYGILVQEWLKTHK